ncbi:glycosyltransferase family 2 protein [Nocardioides caldifontis]|uniref:glycosyltransferase family 2 protein n=1 Tax=Nocardioides caldifontis TaxID=2588938 RepID=UPI00193929D9|nr:glycosyltransferase [Nocardioides caldifontis]
MLAVLAATTVVVYDRTAELALRSYWTLGVLLIAYCLISFVVGRRYLSLPPASGRVLAIVPSYNEDLDVLHTTVRSLLDQTRPPDAICVIDDGSVYPVQPFDDPRVTWMRQENTGKRGAQCTVLRQFSPDEWDFIVTVDSDSAPYPDAVEHLLRSMSNPKVQAATGMIYVRNHDKTWVSTAADMDIGISCVMMRASRSTIGALETTSGALALYRSEILYDHLDAYAVECGTGDDRWLALRALERGDVVGVYEAGVETDMPTSLNGTYRQRLRWARSWWWMLPYVFKNLSPVKILSPTIGLVQLVVTPLMLIWILLALVTSHGDRYSGHLWVLGLYVAAYFSVRMGTSALYLMGRPGVSLRQKVRLWALGTHLATVLNFFWLMPIRYVALFKLFDNRWQTRVVAAPAMPAQRTAPMAKPRSLEEARP